MNNIERVTLIAETVNLMKRCADDAEAKGICDLSERLRIWAKILARHSAVCPVVAAGEARFVTSGGSTVVVDEIDAHLITKYCWCHLPGRGSVSAWDQDLGGYVHLHRLITTASYGLVVDHVNGDVCDNRRANLRITDLTGNAMNRTANRGGHSTFKGVAQASRSTKWRAQIHVSKRQIYLGLFETEVDAALAYDAAAREHFGNFGTFNFPNHGERSSLHVLNKQSITSQEQHNHGF